MASPLWERPSSRWRHGLRVPASIQSRMRRGHATDAIINVLWGPSCDGFGALRAARVTGYRLQEDHVVVARGRGGIQYVCRCRRRACASGDCARV